VTDPKPLMMNPEPLAPGFAERLAELGIDLPTPSKPVAAYVPVVEAGGVRLGADTVRFQRPANARPSR
jgi:hypothetical protein